MMDRMRAATQGWLGRTIMAIVLGFIIVSFGFWGVGDIFRGGDANEVARIGSVGISTEAYRNAYANELQRIQQQARRVVTPDEARRIGLDRQVLARLLTDAVLDQKAAKLGLAVSDADVAKAIFRDDSFQGANGQFDKARFTALLRNNGLTEARYVAEQRTSITRNEITEAAIDGVAVPRALQEAIHRYQLETRTVDYITLPATAAGAVPKPSGTDLQGYYDARKEAYAAPEYRKLVTLAVLPTDLVHADAVGQADIEKRYEDVKASRFTVPEKRTLEQIVIADPAAAAAAKAKLDGGETFAALTAERKLSAKDVSLGTVAKDGLAEKAVADSAFALADGATSQPVPTQFGSVLVHVTAIVPATAQPLAAVAATLRDEIALSRAQADATKLRDAVEAARSSGKTLTEAATSAGLSVRMIPAVDAQGRDKTGKPVEAIPDGPTVLRAAFGSEVGADTDVTATANGGFVWYEVAGIEPAHALPLAEVKSKVETAWTADEIAKRLATKANDLVKAVDGGQPLATIATENGKLQVVHDTGVTRAGAPTLQTNAVAAIFGLHVGKAGSAAVPGGERILFVVGDAVVPPLDASQPAFAKLIAQVKDGYLDDLLSQYLARLQDTFGIKVNRAALAAAVGSAGDAGS